MSLVAFLVKLSTISISLPPPPLQRSPNQTSLSKETKWCVKMPHHFQVMLFVCLWRTETVENGEKLLVIKMRMERSGKILTS